MAKFYCFVAAVVCLVAGTVSGEEAKEALLGQFPYHVSISRWGKHNCSGAILNEHWIITAASCVHMENLNDIKIVAGVATKNGYGDTYDVEKIVAKEPSLKFEIALIKVQGTVKFNKNVRPVLLDTSFAWGWGITLKTASGWGNDLRDGPLKYSRLDALRKDECTAIYTRHGDFPPLVGEQQNDFVGPETLCANEIEVPSAVELGSPLVTGTGKLVGIALPQIQFPTMNGKPLPPRFTRISAFADWIESVIRTTLWP